VELNWSTFVLEIINFLVLLWILQRFLYRPVLQVIARRRQSIEEQLKEARETQEQAEAMKTQYEGRLADWEGERARARDTLKAELDKQRANELAELRTALQEEREKAEVAQERQRAEQQRAIEHDAVQQAAAFASRLLSQACGPELEQRLVTLLLQQLAELSDDRATALRQQWGEAPQQIQVGSAFELSEQQRQQLEQRLQQVSGLDIPVQFERDGELLAGLRIVIGAWVLAANVRDELKGFAEFTHAPR
jgi:F-type H+-transporting ATPase subunit b